jgi:hypothetical protein
MVVAYAIIAVLALLIALVMLFLTVKHVNDLRRDVNKARRQNYTDQYDDEDDEEDDDNYVYQEYDYGQETDVDEGYDATKRNSVLFHTATVTAPGTSQQTRFDDQMRFSGPLSRPSSAARKKRQASQPLA